jgi:hypothetical protein
LWDAVKTAKDANISSLAKTMYEKDNFIPHMTNLLSSFVKNKKNSK